MVLKYLVKLDFSTDQLKNIYSSEIEEAAFL